MDLGALVKKEKLANKQILEKAIQKAERNGWNNKTRRHSGIDQLWMIDADNNPSLEELIYNHDFAKALWGKDTLSPNYGDLEMLSEPDYAWEHHLQQMVIADDPIKYLGDNLDG